MKKHRKLVIGALFAALLLVGCKPKPVPSCNSCTLSEDVVTTSKDVVTTESEDVTTSEEITTETPGPHGTRKLEFFGINDFHGAITETTDEPGIFKISSYLKSRYAQNEGGTVFLNAGDYWQGSADSNINRGKFLTRAMNELSADAMTIGNHEFDWFDTTIKHNRTLAEYPFLGANIMDKATGELATELVHYDDTFKASTMVIKNDVKVGIVGTIGPYLESSILATAVEPYSFELPEAYIRAEVNNLKAQGADVIALVIHDSLVYSLGSYSNIFDEKLVDLVFTGHAHIEDNKRVNGIPVLQTTGNGKQIMEVEATYNFDLKTFTVDKSSLVEASYIKGAFNEDVAMRTLFSEYEAEINEVKNVVIGTLSSDIDQSGLANLANQRMHSYAVSKAYPNIVAVHNLGGVRVKSIKSGEVTYGQIYQAFPFDNEVMVIEDVSGATVKSYIRSHPFYIAGGENIKDYETYTIVTIDYLSISEYSNIKDEVQIHTGEYVRELIADYFRDTGVIDGSSY